MMHLPVAGIVSGGGQSLPLPVYNRVLFDYSFPLGISGSYTPSKADALICDSAITFGVGSAMSLYSDGLPKALDESSWTEWGAQPLFWNEHGQMDNNLGSAGNMTRNGTIVIGKGGNA